jgi:hypothetical protein
VGTLGKGLGKGGLDPILVSFEYFQPICALVRAIDLELHPLIVVLWGAGEPVDGCKFLLHSGLSVCALRPENLLGNHKLDRKSNLQGQVGPGCKDSSDTKLVGINCIV